PRASTRGPFSARTDASGARSDRPSGRSPRAAVCVGGRRFLVPDSSSSHFVIAGLVAAIHHSRNIAWTTGTSPVVTLGGSSRHIGWDLVRAEMSSQSRQRCGGGAQRHPPLGDDDIPYPPTRSNHSSSVIPSTPSSCARVSLEPAPGPATRMSVWPETEPATL